MLKEMLLQLVSHRSLDGSIVVNDAATRWLYDFNTIFSLLTSARARARARALSYTAKLSNRALYHTLVLCKGKSEKFSRVQPVADFIWLKNMSITGFGVSPR
jgi:hypothetical protein